MKILMYSVHDGEVNAVEEYAQNNDVEIITTDKPLSVDNYELASNVDGISIQQTTPIPDEIVYQKLAEYGIKQLALRTAGFDIISFEHAKKYNLKITNVPAYSPNAIAEMALTHTMNLVRKMYITLPKVAQKNFSWPGSLAPEIRSLTVGIIGVGRIGSVYARLISGLGARVIGYDIVVRPENEGVVEYQTTLDDLLQKADVISIHTPLDESTQNMINENTLKLMKSNAYLINTARGGIVNSDDLISALKNKVIAGAGLDTLDCEVGYFEKDYSQSTIESPQLKELLALENVIITPHIAFFTKTALKNMVDISLDSLQDILKSGSSKNLVSK